MRHRVRSIPGDVSLDVLGVEYTLQNRDSLWRQLVYTLLCSDSYVSRSRLDGDLQGSSTVHLVQRLLVVLELEDIGDLICRLQDHDFWLSNDENAPFPRS